MLDSLLSLLSGNIDYTLITGIIVIYFASLWIILTLWVFVDSKKRFGTLLWPIVFTITVLPLNIPVLVLYLIMRPELEDENVVYLKGDGQMKSIGGVNLPLMNFVDSEGDAVLSLEIKVAKKPSELHDAKLGLEWVSKKETFKSKEIESAKETKPDAVLNNTEGQTDKTKKDSFSIKDEVFFWKSGVGKTVRKAKNIFGKTFRKKTNSVFEDEKVL